MNYIVTLKAGTDMDTAISEIKDMNIIKKFDFGVLVGECSAATADEISKLPFVDNVNVETTAKVQESEDIKLFSEYLQASQAGLQYLTESENAEVDSWVKIFEEEYGNDLANLDEGFFGRLVGGAAGFLVGPTIGRVIANALGIEKGVLFDMFTSRLVSAALGSAIAKSFEKKK
jgi:hypothetical protein